MTQENTLDLLENRVSFFQKMVYSTLLILSLSIFGYMIGLPYTGGLISLSLIFLIGLYIYSNIRWYIQPDGKNKSQKGYILATAFVVFMFIISVIFKLYHWQGAGYLMMSTLGILIFLPVFMSVRFFIRNESSSSHVIMEVIKKN